MKKRAAQLSKKERQIEASLANDEWMVAPRALKDSLIRDTKRAVATKKKEARVNIRLTQEDVDLIRIKADQEGLGYQTLMSSILHKYATGRLVEKSIAELVASEVATRVQQIPARKKT